MSTTTFKLTSRDGETRRISFNTSPSWEVLAQRIQLLFDIPFDQAAVTYIDGDGDTVTLSTAEELRDFYQTSYTQGEMAKFTVQDLRQSRAESLRSFADTPTDTGSRRNTFGKDPILQFHIDEDWQSVPAFNTMFQPPLPSEHGFIESVNSFTDDEALPKLDKGKSRAYTPSFHSTGSSVIGDGEMMTSTPKPVMSDFGPFPAADKELPNLFSVASSTPRMEDHPLKRAQNSVTPIVGTDTNASTRHHSTAATPNRPSLSVSDAVSDAEASDPPLAPLPDTTATRSQTPSLATDIAFLVDTVTSVFHSHPEVAEGFKTVIRNASNGTYWNSHRENIAKAASEYSQTATSQFSKAEAEAGKKVSEALAALARAAGQATGATAEGTGSAEESVWWAPPPPPAGDWPPMFGGMSHHGEPFGHPFFAPSHIGQGRRGGHRGRGGHFGPHSAGHVHVPHGPHRGPPGPPPHDMYPIPPMPVHHHLGSHFHPPPPPPPFFDESTPNHNRTRQLRADVEAAKLLYKQHKERYRQDRAERQKLKKLQRTIHDVEEDDDDDDDDDDEDTPKPKPSAVIPPASPRPASISQVVSHAKGSFPQVDMVGFTPKRSNTHSGYITAKDRAIGRITRKLADMGFTESAHPQMISTIRSHVPENGEVSKEGEDNIVTTFIEELDQEPKEAEQPRASSSTFHHGKS